MKKVDIIVLHFGDLSDTNRCLESIEKNISGYRTLYIVNNDPNIDISKVLKSHTNRVYMNSEKNIGFAAGINLGIKHALDQDADYIVLVNNDTETMSDFISPSIKFLAENKQAGIIAPIISFKKGGLTYYDNGGHIQDMTGRTSHLNTTEITKKSPFTVPYVSGCCMIVKKEVFQKAGLFDEKFFLYYEDVDLCLRTKDKGYDIYVDPRSTITHELSKTVGINSGTAIYNLIKSRNIFGSKYKKKYPLHTLFMMYQSFIFLMKSPRNWKHIIYAWK